MSNSPSSGKLGADNVPRELEQLHAFKRGHMGRLPIDFEFLGHGWILHHGGIGRHLQRAAAAELAQRAPKSAARDQTVALKAYYDRRAKASGARAGVSTSQIAQDVDTLRQGILARMHAPDPAKAEAERADNAAMLKNCAALPKLEAADRLSEGK